MALDINNLTDDLISLFCFIILFVVEKQRIVWVSKNVECMFCIHVKVKVRMTLGLSLQISDRLLPRENEKNGQRNVFSVSWIIS